HGPRLDRRQPRRRRRCWRGRRDRRGPHRRSPQEEVVSLETGGGTRGHGCRRSSFLSGWFLQRMVSPADGFLQWMVSLSGWAQTCPMPEASDNRVAVYIDFDNVVISRYAQVHPSHRRVQLSGFTDDPFMKAKLAAAT